MTCVVTLHTEGLDVHVHVQLRVLEEAMSDQRQEAANDLEQTEVDAHVDALDAKRAAGQVVACMCMTHDMTS
jgi:hypothetical protein